MESGSATQTTETPVSAVEGSSDLSLREIIRQELAAALRNPSALPSPPLRQQLAVSTPRFLRFPSKVRLALPRSGPFHDTAGPLSPGHNTVALTAPPSRVGILQSRPFRDAVGPLSPGHTAHPKGSDLARWASCIAARIPLAS